MIMACSSTLKTGGRKMKIAFAGFRHPHIFPLYESAKVSDKFTLAGCFEEDEATKNEIEKNKEIVCNFSSYEEILKDDSIQAVAIGDYYGKRGGMIIDALLHNKHVICDKPLCTSLDEFEKIKELSEQKKLTVCCMLDLRYMPQIRTVKKLIAENEIGDIQIASFTGQHPLNYGVRPMWYFEKGKHGGTINDIAIHGIDLLRYLTGKNLTNINCAKTWNAFADKEPDFKDSAQFMIEMDNMSVMADVSYAAPNFDGIMPTYWNFKLWGTKGMINFEYCDKDIHIFKDKETVISCEDTPITLLDDFYNEIMGENTLLNTKDILESQEQVLKIQQAAN